jgi:SAM-dependent methyltransferase
MGPWPFDRLVAAVAPLCAGHEVFVQTGTSTVVPPCPHRPYLSPAETLRRIRDADVVVTHGGNSVRLVQRAGKVPVAVAREAARGEMRNDHQVAYLAAERHQVRVLAGDRPDLLAAVTDHPAVERERLAAAPPLPAPADPADHLDRLLAPPEGPFTAHPLARYGWAWSQLAGREGRHLDLGVGTGEFTAALHRDTKLDVVAADPHPDYLRTLRAAVPDLPLVRTAARLPFRTGGLDSASALDVLEHVADERATLAELHRVLRPGGLLVLTVPARHLFSVLDPDDAKLRVPRVHRAVYRRRFGAAEYAARFVDATNGLRGDMDWTRRPARRPDRGRLHPDRPGRRRPLLAAAAGPRPAAAAPRRPPPGRPATPGRPPLPPGQPLPHRRPRLTGPAAPAGPRASAQVVVQQHLQLGVQVQVRRLGAGRHQRVAPGDEVGQHRPRHREQGPARRRAQLHVDRPGQVLRRRPDAHVPVPGRHRQTVRHERPCEDPLDRIPPGRRREGEVDRVRVVPVVPERRVQQHVRPGYNETQRHRCTDF